MSHWVEISFAEFSKTLLPLTKQLPLLSFCKSWWNACLPKEYGFSLPINSNSSMIHVGRTEIIISRVRTMETNQTKTVQIFFLFSPFSYPLPLLLPLPFPLPLPNLSLMLFPPWKITSLWGLYQHNTDVFMLHVWLPWTALSLPSIRMWKTSP